MNQSHVYTDMGFPGGLAVKNPPAKAGDLGLIPGSGKSRDEGNDNPPKYSCLEISEEPGRLQFMGSQKSQIHLSHSTTTNIYIYIYI